VVRVGKVAVGVGCSSVARLGLYEQANVAVRKAAKAKTISHLFMRSQPFLFG